MPAPSAGISGLHFLPEYDINMGSINAQIGKIAGLQIAERGGRRLKAVLSCAAWFAQERPLRGGRVFRRYPETSAYYKIRMRVVPRKAGLSSQKSLGRRAFFVDRVKS